MNRKTLSGVTASDLAGKKSITSAELKAAVLKKQKKGKARYQRAEKPRRTRGSILFDSILEADAYDVLLDAAIPFCRQVPFILQEKFTDPDGKTQRAIKYVADFVIGTDVSPDPNAPIPSGIAVVDMKGHETEIFKRSKKMFVWKFKVKLHTPKTLSALKEIIQYVRLERSKNTQ